MEPENSLIQPNTTYPILFLPKKCTTLESNYKYSDNVYIDVSITSVDTDGNNAIIYNGVCNVKLVNSDNLIVNQVDTSESLIDESQIDQISQSQVWIDPSRSPYVYNHYDPSIQYNCNKSNYREPQQSPVNDFECKQYRKVQETMMTAQMDGNLNCYEQDEFECDVFLSQLLPEEILSEKQTRVRDEQTVVPENNALKQLMSPVIKSTSEQRKTIMFLGNDSHSGQTIQNISYNDPSMQCANIDADMESDLVTDSSGGNIKKKYQCDKCKQIFHQLSTFRMHMVKRNSDSNTNIKQAVFKCQKCGKKLNNLKKLEIHCLRHGNPDLECPQCGKVFSNKFSLYLHKKIHNRKYPCSHCTKSYAKFDEFKKHLKKVHFIFSCADDNCSFVSSDTTELEEHQLSHRTKENLETLNVEDVEVEVLDVSSMMDSENLQDLSSWDHDFSLSNHDLSESSNDREISREGLKEPSQDLAGSSHDLAGSSHDLAGSSHDELGKDFAQSVDDNAEERIKEADSVIAQVISNTIFLLSSAKARTHPCRKTCAVCQKSFKRIDYLKRHLIEHVIKSTLAKIPVTRTKGYNITCEVCQTATFMRLDKYKAHLREHAKLTLYKCTLCDKSFSDSSNFSKHKIKHSMAYLQCDLCLRKFNSKKMIIEHMQQHNNTSPVKCSYCYKVFHFESMLKKHVRSAHKKVEPMKFRCRFCEQTFRSSKDKLDHEWREHSFRKVIVDCQICGAQYRKYCELKRHCLDEHGMYTPSARILLKKRRSKGKVSYE